MSAESAHRRSRSIIHPWPTPTGGAVIAAVAVAYLLAERTVVAIGFLVPIGVAMALDFAFSALALASRPVTVQPLRRIAATPSRLSFTVTARRRAGAALQIVVQRITLLNEDADFVTLELEDSAAEVELPGPSSRAAKHVRYRVAASLLGLVWARRWEVQEVPMLHRAAGPNGDVDVPVEALDEVARLREYVPGDRLGRVAWPTTARTGRLHVRHAGIDDHEATVVLDLGGDMTVWVDDRAQADVLIEQTASVVDHLWRTGATVRLVTHETVMKLFDDERDSALRRPALVGRANLKVAPGAEATIDGRPAGQFVSAVVSDSDELVRRLSLAEHHPTAQLPPPPFVLVSPAGVQSVS